MKTMMHCGLQVNILHINKPVNSKKFLGLSTHYHGKDNPSHTYTPGPAYTNVASAKNYKQSTMRLLGLIKSNKGYLAGFY